MLKQLHLQTSKQIKTMQETAILWADDEIEFLKPHILFLEQKGYKMTTATNGSDALDLVKSQHFDLVFLDENMPGLTGLETLAEIKTIKSDLPVVLITKNEAESLMEDAIGSKIADYLIKPVNPNQVLLTIKKLVDNTRLVSEKTSSAYQQDFRNLGMALNDVNTHEAWVEVYKKLIYWELELEKLKDEPMHEILQQQKSEANLLFSKFIDKNYIGWIKNPDKAPIQSYNIMRKKTFPLLADDRPVFFLLIDNLRYDQWKVIHPLISAYFKLEQEEHFYSILPTATHYARNAIFAGMMPADIVAKFPKLWVEEDEEQSKNQHEGAFLTEQIKNVVRRPIKHSYHKILNLDEGRNLVDNIHSLMNNQLNVIVYNFVDMLSHARTEMEMIKELASDEAAYRSITRSWFEHSPLMEIIRKISQKKVKLVVTTDHGTMRVKTPVKVVGDRNTNTNLRYKLGKNLNYNPKEVFEIKNPLEAGLPKNHVSTAYIFSKDDGYFIYPNNYNHFANMYHDTFQHGGISLEEMIVPYIVYESK